MNREEFINESQFTIEHPKMKDNSLLAWKSNLNLSHKHTHTRLMVQMPLIWKRIRQTLLSVYNGQYAQFNIQHTIP